MEKRVSFPQEHFQNINNFINDINNDDFSKAHCQSIVEILSKPPIDFNMLSTVISFGVLSSNAGLRSLCWKAFSNYYPKDTSTSFTSFFNEKRNIYYSVKKHYILSSSPSETPKVIQLIKKDLLRTRNSLNFMNKQSSVNSSETHLQVLINILTVFTTVHQDIGYHQGMNEIVFLFYYCFVLDDNEFFSLNAEADTFWCFSHYIISLRDVYTYTYQNELGVKTHLDNIKRYLQIMDLDLDAHLPNENSILDFLLFEWYFTGMSQNFSIDKSLFIFDNILSEQTNRYLYLEALCVSTLKFKRNAIISCANDMNAIITELKKLKDEHVHEIVGQVRKTISKIREIIVKENSAFIILN